MDKTLRRSIDDFIQHWGEMGSVWGVNKVMGQLHALLIASPDPLTLDDMADSLGISRSNASMNIRELRAWGVVRKVFVRGDRKDYYVAEDNIWKLLTQIVKERKRREFEPTLEAMNRWLRDVPGVRDTLGDKEAETADVFVKRLSDMRGFLEAVDFLAELFVTAGPFTPDDLKSLAEQRL